MTELLEIVIHKANENILPVFHKQGNPSVVLTAKSSLMLRVNKLFNSLDPPDCENPYEDV